VAIECHQKNVEQSHLVVGLRQGFFLLNTSDVAEKNRTKAREAINTALSLSPTCCGLPNHEHHVKARLAHSAEAQGNYKQFKALVSVPRLGPFLPIGRSQSLIRLIIIFSCVVSLFSAFLLSEIFTPQTVPDTSVYIN
jgi:hypothetical protein